MQRTTLDRIDQVTDALRSSLETNILQFLLSDAVDTAAAVAAVRAMGLDPDAIPRYKPSNT
jgi:hypothetical protein